MARSSTAAGAGVAAVVWADEGGQRRGRVGCGGRLLGAVEQAGEVAHQRGLDQRFLGREVPEHGGDTDAGQPRDLFGGAGFAARAEDVLGGGEDALAVLPGILARGSTLTEVWTSLR